MARIKEVSLEMQDCALISLSMEVESLLGVQPPIDPFAVQDKIEKLLEKIVAGDQGVPPDETLVAGLAAFWGMTIAQAFNWQLIAVECDGWRGLGFSDLDRRYLALPMNYFHELVFNDPQHLIPGPAVRFNAIKASYLPESEPGMYTIITS